MTKRFHENCPEILRPHTKYSSRRELSFDVLDSSFVVATAGGDSVGRGETLTHVHASELAFWPKSTALEIWNGLTQAVPNTKGTAIFVESTANGVTGIYHDLWRGAVDGTNGFVPVFIPWFSDPTTVSMCLTTFERTPEEDDLVEQYDLDDEQLMFRDARSPRTASICFGRNTQQNPKKPSSPLDDLSSILSSCKAASRQPEM
jgi:hypothetical protein